MKKLLTTLLCIGSMLPAAWAQFYVAPGSTFYIEPGTAFAYDGMYLQSGTALVFSGQTIVRAATALQNLDGDEGILRTYSIDPPVEGFVGLAGLYYNESELNGNSENLLFFAYTDNGILNIPNFTVRSTASNWVKKQFPSIVNMGQITAAQKPGGCLTAPPAPGPIEPPAITRTCPGDVRTYSIDPVPGALSYSWTAPDGGTIISGQGTTSITVEYGSSFIRHSPVQVASVNACGASRPRKYNVTRGPRPDKPSAITGPLYGACGGSGIPYSVNALSGTTYTWAFDNDATIATGQGTAAIAVDFATGFTSSIVRVTATNGCGTSSDRRERVYGKPGLPGAITGPAQVCPGQSGVTYSIAPVQGAVSYTWNVPAGSSISDGASTGGSSLTTTSPSITVSFGAAAGAVKVRANSSCGNSSFASRTVFHNCMPRLATTVEDKVALYPVPADNTLNISFNAGTEDDVKVMVVDALGKTVITRTESVFAGSNQLSLDVSALAPGAYFLRMVSTANSEFRVQKPFIVQ